MTFLERPSTERRFYEQRAFFSNHRVDNWGASFIFCSGVLRYFPQCLKAELYSIRNQLQMQEANGRSNF